MANYEAHKNGVETRFQPQETLVEPLAKMTLSTRHYQRVYDALNGRVDRQALIRRYVLEGLKRDRLLD
jgi:hypothetical protein